MAFVEAILAAIVDGEDLIGNDDAIAAGKCEGMFDVADIDGAFAVGEDVGLREVCVSEFFAGEFDGCGCAGGHEAVEVWPVGCFPNLAGDGVVAQRLHTLPGELIGHGLVAGIDGGVLLFGPFEIKASVWSVVLVVKFRQALLMILVVSGQVLGESIEIG
jgi:hypothetical protein